MSSSQVSSLSPSTAAHVFALEKTSQNSGIHKQSLDSISTTPCTNHLNICSNTRNTLETIYQGHDQKYRSLKRLGQLTLTAAGAAGLALGIAAGNATAKSWLVTNLAGLLAPFGITALNLPWVGLAIMTFGITVGFRSLMAARAYSCDVSTMKKVCRNLNSTHNDLKDIKDIKESLQHICCNFAENASPLTLGGWLALTPVGAAGLTLGITAGNAAAKFWLVTNLLGLLAPFGITALNLPWVGLAIVTSSIAIGSINFMAAHTYSSLTTIIAQVGTNFETVYDTAVYAINEKSIRLQNYIKNEKLIRLQNYIKEVGLISEDSQQNAQSSSSLSTVAKAQKIVEQNTGLWELLKDFLMNPHLWGNMTSYEKALCIIHLPAFSTRNSAGNEKIWTDIKNSLMYLYKPEMSSQTKIRVINTLLLTYSHTINKKISDLRCQLETFLKKFEFLKHYSDDPNITDETWIQSIKLLYPLVPDTDIRNLQDFIIKGFDEAKKNGESQKAIDELNNHDQGSDQGILLFLNPD